MPRPHKSTPDPERDRDATIIAHVVALVHARRKRDYLTATDAHRELDRLGVSMRFHRIRKSTHAAQGAQS